MCTLFVFFSLYYFKVQLYILKSCTYLVYVHMYTYVFFTIIDKLNCLGTWHCGGRPIISLLEPQCQTNFVLEPVDGHIDMIYILLYIYLDKVMCRLHFYWN